MANIRGSLIGISRTDRSCPSISINIFGRSLSLLDCSTMSAKNQLKNQIFRKVYRFQIMLILAKSKKPCYLIPSMCVLSTVKASVLSMAVLLPSLLTQADAFLIAYELKDHVDAMVDTSLLREA